MNKFRRFFLDGNQCRQMYGACPPREELNELMWMLDAALRHRCARGFTGEVRDFLKDAEDVYEHASDEVVEWTRDDAFGLFERIAAARGCVFMLHPDFPGEALLMTRAWARRGGFIDV